MPWISIFSIKNLQNLGNVKTSVGKAHCSISAEAYCKPGQTFKNLFCKNNGYKGEFKSMSDILDGAFFVSYYLLQRLNMLLKWLPIESAKLRGLCVHVPACLAYLRVRALRAYVLTCLAYSHANVPKCLHAITSNNKNTFSVTCFS